MHVADIEAHAGTAGDGEGDGLAEALGEGLGLGLEELDAEGDGETLGVVCVDATGVALPQAASTSRDASAPTLRLTGMGTSANEI